MENKFVQGRQYTRIDYLIALIVSLSTILWVMTRSLFPYIVSGRNGALFTITDIIFLIELGFLAILMILIGSHRQIEQ